MFKRPTSRRKTSSEGVTLNLVPMMDALVTLVSFLLFTMSFLSIVHLESPFPEINPAQTEKLKENPLQLTLTLKAGGAEIWSPFSRISSKTIPHQPDGTPNLSAIHQALVEVKLQFPKEVSVVFMPEPGVTYDTLISLMDTARNLEATDPPIFMKNEQTGNDEPLKYLFPQIVFGNLLGAS